MKKILFLGYKKNKLINSIKKNKKYIVKNKNNSLNLNDVKKYDLIITYGYKKIIPNKFILAAKRPIINLHIGYLPYNRGAHPNFWAFAENTPSGVTIHEVDSGIDTGKIIFQKQVNFDLINNRKLLNFKNTYKVLRNEIEKLFEDNFEELVNYNYRCFNQIGLGTFHYKKDLPLIVKNWSQNVYKTILKHDLGEKKKINKKLKILDEVEKTRKNNNINWMDIVRTSLKNSPNRTLKILQKINSDDRKITKLFKILSNK